MKATNSISLLLITLVLAAFLSACQLGPFTANEDDAPSDLEKLDPDGALVIYWHALTGTAEDHLLEMIDDFNASNEWGITVVGEYQGDLETLYDKVRVGLPTGELPHLVVTDPSLAAAYASLDAAVPLAPYIESTNWGFTRAERNDFFPSALKSDRLPQFGNQIYSIPSCRSLQVLYYNVDWLKRLGDDAPPQTWEAFREQACAASLPTDGLFGFEMGMDSSIFSSLLTTQNASLLNIRATAYTLGDEQGRAALQFLQDLMSEGCAQWEPLEGTMPADFIAGRTLFVIDSTTRLLTYQRAIAEGANFAWAVSSLPHTTEQPLIGVHGNSMTILHSTPREQLASWLFIKWLTEPEQQARWSQHMACFPTRRSAFEEMEAFLEAHPQYSLTSQLLEQEWITEPNVTAYSACGTEIGRMLYEVTAGASVEKLLSDTQTHCTQTLNDAME
jgi:ABC-type glycerol-3-phosphate transport system substrate-binding protein